MGNLPLSKVDEVIYKAPECMIYGNDESRSKWFNTNEIKNTSEFIINRAAIDISATKVRRLMVENNRREWMKWVNPRLHKMYDELRGQLMEVPFYKAMEQEAWRNEND